MKKKSKAIVLLSGGMDSTTCLAWAVNHFHEVKAIGFNYGQKHLVEINQAKAIAEIFGVDYKVFDIRGLMFGSSLVDLNQSTADVHKKDNNLPSSFTAGRNLLFLTIAASFGYEDETFELVTGICEADEAGYPDCREAFRVSAEKTISLATDKEFKIHAPLIKLSKAETWKMAHELSIPVSIKLDRDVNVLEVVRTMTLTDYNGDTTMNPWGMGKEDNPASVGRAQSYRRAIALGYIPTPFIKK